MELIREEQENFVVCPSCGYRVPRTPVCIRCGFDLSGSKLTSKPPSVPHAASAPSEARTEKRPESNVGRLLNYVIWRAKIVWLLLEGKVSKEIFERIYRDYTSKINSLLASEGGVTNLMEAFSVVSRLREAKRNLDELMVRHRIGEVSDKEYISNYTALMSELSVLEREAMKAEFQYNHLKRVIGEFLGGRYSSLKEQIEKCYERLPRMIEEQNIIDVEIAETVKRDLELIMQVLETLGHEQSGGLVGSEAPSTLERVPGYPEEDFFDEELIFRRVTSVVKGHDDEIRRIIRAIKMRDNVLIIGRHAEGKTELLLQLHKCLGGIYFHCHEEVSERELIAGFNPSAFVGVNPVHMGCLMQIVSGEVKGLPIAFIDEIMKLRPKTQIILFEAMNNKRFLNPVDGKTYYLPPEFSVVSSSNIESVVQETPDIAFLDRFGKIIMWRDTPDDAVREILKPYGLPSRVVDLILWVRRQVAGMRYLVPVSIRNLQKLALEYNRYRSTYRNPEELKKLIIDRLLKVRVLNVFGLREFEEAKKKIEQYIGERLGGVV